MTTLPVLQSDFSEITQMMDKLENEELNIGAELKRET